MLRTLFIAIFISQTYCVHAQVPEHVDLLFGDSGKVEVDIDEYDYLSKIKVLDSVLYFAGYTGHYDTALNYDAIIGRLDYHGNLDTTFNDSGYIRFDFPGDNHSSITDMDVGDSGIYFIGNSLDYGVQDTLHLFIGKIHFSGRVDTSFADSGFFTPNLGRYDVGNGISVTSNEQLVFCGTSENKISLTDHPLMGRLHYNGTLDTTFGTTGIRIWDSNGELADSLSSTLIAKHGSGGYLTDMVEIDDNYFFSGYYRPGSNNMCLMILVKKNGDINLNYAGLGYRVFELSPNNDNTIVSNYYVNDTIYSLINVVGSGYGNVTLFAQDTLGTQLDVTSFSLPDWILESTDMAWTPNGDIAVSSYAINDSSSASVDSDGFFIINMNSQGVYDANYNDDGFFLDAFDLEESGIEDLCFSDGVLFSGGFVRKMASGNEFDFCFMKLINNPSLGIPDVNQTGIIMYPNPVSDILRIESSESNLFTLQLFNVAGERVTQNNVMSDSFELNVSEIPKGIYVITIKHLSTGIIESQKIIIE